MKPFTESGHCQSLAHCRTCRADATWREKVGAPDVCPFQTGLGDVIEKLAKPIARALRLPCYGPDGKLKPQSGCAKRKARANAWGSRITRHPRTH